MCRDAGRLMSPCPLSPLLRLEQTRLQDGLKLLKATPDDPEVLHSVGVGLAHKGIETRAFEGGQVRAFGHRGGRYWSWSGVGGVS